MASRINLTVAFIGEFEASFCVVILPSSRCSARRHLSLLRRRAAPLFRDDKTNFFTNTCDNPLLSLSSLSGRFPRVGCCLVLRLRTRDTMRIGYMTHRHRNLPFLCIYDARLIKVKSDIHVTAFISSPARRTRTSRSSLSTYLMRGCTSPGAVFYRSSSRCMNQ